MLSHKGEQNRSTMRRAVLLAYFMQWFHIIIYIILHFISFYRELELCFWSESILPISLAQTRTPIVAEIGSFCLFPNDASCCPFPLKLDLTENTFCWRARLALQVSWPTWQTSLDCVSENKRKCVCDQLRMKLIYASLINRISFNARSLSHHCHTLLCPHCCCWV
jgi:hypothetical protein